MPPSPLIQPRYDAGGFAALPGRISAELLSKRYDAVILFLVDGLGWRFVEQFQSEPFLRRGAAEGRLEKILAQFPSTTASHVTTIHTGMPVGEHGVLEWSYYEPALDHLVKPLLFSHGWENRRETLLEAGVRPRQILPHNSFYLGLKKKGVPATIFQHAEYTPSTYTRAISSGAGLRGYRALSEALVNLGAAVAESKGPQYLFFYYDRIDTLSHIYGPGSTAVAAEIRMTLAAFETVLLPRLQSSGKKVLFLLTADHGQSETDPATTVYINREPRFAGLQDFLRTDKSGAPLVAAGSCRDFFLYVLPEAVEEAQQFLAARLEGVAEVRRVSDLAEQGFFGPQVTPLFRSRAGELVILPYLGESVWWMEKGRFEQRYFGNHGGLTPEEMEIPLLSWEM